MPGRLNINIMITSTAVLLILMAVCAGVAYSAPASASAPVEVSVRRYLLSAGANNGGRDKVTLRYAVSDAKMFASVLVGMGGVRESDAFILADPTKRQLLDAIGNLGRVVAAGGRMPPQRGSHGGAVTGGGGNSRTEVFIYYSGHADAAGLKLGGETLVWADFRKAVEGLGADVKVTVVDACGSGAITRTKGGDAIPVFMSDASSNMKGYAYLTSSNENENSQESDVIGGSFFTHALVSGARGAADMTGDGKVTVSEAYQYAFNETLQYTRNTSGGTQHPSRDMNLTGTGDIVLTDLRQTNSTLSLGSDVEGRVFIRDQRGNLLAELSKTRGRSVALGIPSGQYAVQMETPSKAWVAGNVTIADGKAAVLAMNDMKPMSARKRTVVRGGRRTGIARAYDRAIIDFSVYADASDEAALSLRAGVPWIYALFEYGQEIDGFSRYPNFTGWGAGTRFGMDGYGLFTYNVDFVMSYIHEKERRNGHVPGGHDFGNYPEDPIYLNLHYKIRAGASYAPLPYLAVTGGLSLNGTMECDHTGGWTKSERFGSMYTDRDEQDHRFHVWPGIYIGLTLGKIKMMGGR